MRRSDGRKSAKGRGKINGEEFQYGGVARRHPLWPWHHRVADEQLAPTAVVQLPDGQILSAFDISFVNADNRTLAVAASRVVGSGGAFGTIIIANTDSNVVTKELGVGEFVGDCSVAPARDTMSGPKRRDRHREGA
jgi:hypothetical protein